MKILFVNFHPVDSQVVRYAAKSLKNKGHSVKFLFSEKENIIEKIIKRDGFECIKIGSIKSGFLNRVITSIFFEINLLRKIKQFKPDILISPSSIYTGIAAKLFKIPFIAWADTETATVNLKSSLPYIDSILIPDVFYEKINNPKKVIKFKAYKEIAYLHPNWFKPDRSILTKLGIKHGEKIVLMRFSELKAMHDIGLKSVGDNKVALLKYIREIEKYARVFISMTEKNLGKEFDKYKLDIHPADYIHLLAYCSLYIGEGTTTASEAGVLGVPWINIQSTTRGYLIDQEENYKLGFRTDDIDHAFKIALEWIQDDELLSKWKKKRDKLLNDKIDVSAFLIWFIENYPESHKIMQENPDYQERFK